MVSFDVVNLFTKVPINEAISIVSELLHKDTTLVERTNLPPDIITDLLKKFLTTTFFKFGDNFYQQTEGAAMGSPLSPVVANIYMEYFENLAIKSTTKKPTIWLRYVDDTFVIWRHGKEQLKGFLEHLNSIKDNIKFTMEEEKQGQLHFLEVLVERVTQQFHTSVFRKPTHTDSYIHYNSNHHPSTKIGTILCLKKGLNTYAKDNHYKENSNT